MTASSKLVTGVLCIAAMSGLAVWLGRDLAGTAQLAEPGEAIQVTWPEPEAMAPVEQADHPATSAGATQASEDAAVAGEVTAREQEPEPDYAAQIRVEDLSPELLGLMRSAYAEFVRGNIEYAAMLAQEAVAISDDNPGVKPILYGMIGYSYEKLGYLDMALEYYRMALALYPLQRNSYDGMRRLDPAFAATHPELPTGSADETEGNSEITE